MAEEEQGGKGSIKLPGIGPANKKVVMVVGGAGAAYVLWRYWQARQASATSDTAAQDPGMTDAGTLPSVSGAVSPSNSYGLPDASGATGTDAYGFHGTTNSQWSQYALTQLSAASDRWPYADIVEALGQYLNNRPLTTTQQAIVQAAIAVAGNPPEGTHPLIPGGNTPITVAPTGLRVRGTPGQTTVILDWNPVAGASGYNIYRSDLTAGQASTGGDPIGDSGDTAFTVQGLEPGHSYTFTVAARDAAGNNGPKSAKVTARTANPSAPAKAPRGFHATGVTASSFQLNWFADTSVSSYHLYQGSKLIGSDNGTYHPFTGLKRGTKYGPYYLAGVNATGQEGPKAGPLYVTTSKK